MAPRPVSSPLESTPRVDPLIAEGLGVSIGGLEVLRGVDLTVALGRVVGVLGPSGAGKSTLFRLLAGELLPTRGTVQLGGVDVSRFPLWKRARLGLGYVPQTPSVLLDLTVSDNVRTFERAARAPVRRPEERAASVGLEGRLHVRAVELSGGERRRLEVLRALIADPAVLVCDEPFAGGDPVHVRLLASLLRGHADRGRAVLLADHRIGDALGICDEALLLADGRVFARAPASEFAEHPAVRGRYLGAV
jgi:lipopolysaccharide export system ATP-binding protein